jgi:hypothetical protein
MANKSFNRSCRVVVQDKLLKGLDVEFRIDRSLKAAQNTAEITIFNLSEENRKYIQGLKTAIVQLQAGYAGPSPISPATASALSAIGVVPSGDPPLIFLGELREINNLREGADWITKISSGDGDEQRKSPVSFSLGPGADFQSAVKKVIQEMGVGVGNSLRSISQGRFADAGNQFIEGLTVHGNGGDELRKLLQSAEMEYSIQNGALQVLPLGKTLNSNAVLLSPKTGLIGSPEMDIKGTLKFRSLLNAEISPGKKVKIESAAVDGFFRVERAVYLGQTRGNDWYVDCEGKAV